MSNTTMYQSEKRANPAPFVPNFPAFKNVSKGNDNIAPAPKLRPAPRPLTPRTHQNYPPASTPILAGGSFTPQDPTVDISLHDAIMCLYRDLPRAVDIAECRAPYLEDSEKNQLNAYRAFLTTPYMLSLLMLVRRENITTFTLAQPLIQNPLMRVAQVIRAMIEALELRGQSDVSIEAIYDPAQDEDDVQRRIMGQLAQMLREINTVKNARSDFRSLLPA